MKTIGIDIGTTTISIVLVDLLDHRILQSFTLPNGAFLPTAHSWERLQAPAAILKKIYPTLDGLLSAHHDILSIGLTGQMHGIVYVDKNGSAVSPLYTWQDTRGGLPDYDNGKSVCQILRESYGMKLSPGYGIATHLYNLKKGLVPPQALYCCTIADYLGLALTGRHAPLLHISQAASLGLYNCKTNDFERNIASENRISAILPAVTKELEPLGVFRGIPVYVSLGDNQASFLGSVGKDAEAILVNIGTGSQISVLSDTCFEEMGIEARPFTKDSYLLVGAALCGGSAFATLEEFFREYAIAAGGANISQYHIMKQLLEQQNDKAESWQVKTTFSGTRVDPHETGSIQGIRLDNFHPAALIRGVLNGMTEELYDLYHILECKTNIPRTKLIASGNAIRKNPALQAILQDRFGIPLTLVPHQEEAAYGAAVAALSSSPKK